MSAADPPWHTIKVAQSGDFELGFGEYSARIYQDIASEPGAPDSIKQDWQTLAAWVGKPNGDLNGADWERIGLAFRTYVATRPAPTIALREPFKHFREEALSKHWAKIAISDVVADVFDRMLASPEDITATRRERAAAALALNAAFDESRRRAESVQRWVSVAIGVVVAVFVVLGILSVL